MKLRYLLKTVSFSALLLVAASDVAFSQGCQYLGGYPWKTGGCLVADDLNAAISGRNQLLNFGTTPHKWVSGFNNGEPLLTQPAFSDLSGTLKGQIPASALDSLGGVYASTAPAHQFFYSLNTQGKFLARQPNFLDIVGIAAPTQLPLPTPTSLGGVNAKPEVAGEVVTGLDDFGNLTTAVVNFTGAMSTDGSNAAPVVTFNGTNATNALRLTSSNAFTKITGAPTSGGLFLIPNDNGANPGVRFVTTGGNVGIESVDATGVGSFQPMALNGSSISFGNVPVTFGGVTGSTQCLQANSSGLLSGTTKPCNLTPLTIGWTAGVDPNQTIIYTASRAGTVVDIRGRVAVPVGVTAQATVYKAANNTSCPSGIPQHTAPFSANGTANANQIMTLAGGAANTLAVGDSLCLVTTGVWAGGLGNGGLTVSIQ